MRSLLAAVLTAITIPAFAQQMDMEAMQRWGGAKVIYYAVEGVHSGQASMTATMGGFGDVADRVTMTFEYSLTEARIVKMTSLRNYPSEVKNLRDYEKTCLPPVLKGPYELATVLEVVNGFGGAINLKVERAYPVVEVAQNCTASRRSIPAEKKVDVETMGVPSPMLLAMGMPPSGQISFSADRKSIIFKQRQWTWTFTPSLTPIAAR